MYRYHYAKWIKDIMLNKTLTWKRRGPWTTSSMYFRNCVIISPWKKAEPVVWTKLNILHPRMLCAKFCWNRPSEFKCIFAILLLSPLGLRRAPLFGQNSIPFIQGKILPNIFKIGQWFWRIRILNFVNVF